MPELSGTGIEDLLQALGETLFDGADVHLDSIDDELQLVKEVDTSKWFPLYSLGANGAEYLNIIPPKGKVWIIHDMRLILSTDATVQDRTLTINKMFLRPGDVWVSCCAYIDATVAASTSYDVQLHAAASADPESAIDSYLDMEKIIIAGQDFKGRFGECLRMRCADVQADDWMRAQLSIEERQNYMR